MRTPWAWDRAAYTSPTGRAENVSGTSRRVAGIGLGSRGMNPRCLFAERAAGLGSRVGDRRTP